MKLVVDEQLPPALADWLRLKGHDAVHVRDIGLKSARDELISEYARQSDAIIVTKDEDFATQAGHVVLWLRFGNVTNRRLLARLEVEWPAIETLFLSGLRVVEVR